MSIHAISKMKSAAKVMRILFTIVDMSRICLLPQALSSHRACPVVRYAARQLSLSQGTATL